MKARLFVFLALLVPASFACLDEEEPPSIVRDLRILAISAEPADLVMGETMAFEALVTNPADSEVSYAWEWCPFTEGADAFYDCPVDEENPEIAELFDLGTEPTAALDSLTASLVVAGICEALEEGLDDLGEYEALLDYIDLPDCELGMDVTIRLTVSADSVERIAIKRVFIWMSDPEELQRNRNPVIESIEVDETALAADAIFEAQATQELEWYVDVPADSLESYLLRSEPTGNERRETITYDFYTTRGTWEEDKEWGSFADDDYIMREEAGKAVLRLDHTPGGEVFNTHFVVRDDRGGIAWTTRQVTITE